MVQVYNLSDGENVYHTCSNIYLTNIILILLLLLSCSIAICYIRWCLLLLLIGPKVIFLLLPGSPAPVLLPSNFSTKNKKILQSCFLLFWFLIHIFQDIFVCLSSVSSMPGFSSVFIPRCVNDRSNSVARNFSKLLSILSDSFPKSSISLVELLLGK